MSQSHGARAPELIWIKCTSSVLVFKECHSVLPFRLYCYKMQPWRNSTPGNEFLTRGIELLRSERKEEREEVKGN